MNQQEDVRISDDEENDEMDECQRDLTPDLNGGVLKQIVQGGKYKAKPILDDGVLIHVVGTLKKENKVFYNTRKLEKPVRSKLGSPNLPTAIDMALRTMKKHEIALLTCKPEYAYKDEPYKNEDFICEVPANSTVIFEVELLDFRFYDLTKYKDGGVLFMRNLKKGTGKFYPCYNSEVCCDISSYDTCGDGCDLRSFCVTYDDEHCKGDYKIEENFCEEVGEGDQRIAKIYTKSDDSECMENDITLFRDPRFKYIEKKEFTWTLGEGEFQQMPKGVEIAIENMVVGEKSLFMIRYDYMKEILTEEELKQYKEEAKFYMFLITLISCKKAKEYYEMNTEERIKEGLECKQMGNHYLTERGNVKLALKRFKRAIDLLETSIDLDGESKERDELLFSCYLNISKAYFDARTPDLCEEYLEKALKMKPNNEKAMYRHGLLLMERKLYTEAKAQFESLLAQYPSNKAAIRLVNECERKAIEQSNVERHLFAKMGKAVC